MNPVKLDSGYVTGTKAVQDRQEIHIYDKRAIPQKTEDEGTE